MPNRLPRAKTLKGDPKLVYYDKGEGRPGETPLVLVHGATLRSEDWENIHPRLATRYRVVAYDQRGHGKSGHAADYSLDALAGDLLRVLRDVAKAPAIVIAHSLGAAVAVVAATRGPGLIRGLVLEDPYLAQFGTGWGDDYYRLLRAALDKVAEPGAFRTAIGRLPLPVAGPRGERTVSDVRGFYAPERLVTYFTPLDPAFVDAFRAQSSAEADVLRAAVAASRVPVLLLAADPRQGTTLADGEAEALRATWQASLVRFPGVGHRIHGTRPEPFLEPLEPFLRANRTL